MVIINDGSVSGVLPEAQVFAVHYPGYPSSTSRAIETLGGMEGIVKTRSSISNYLELHFRPEDPYSHPAFGELRPCSSLLLRISRKKPPGDQATVISDKSSNYLGVNMFNLDAVTCFSEVGRNGLQNLSRSKMPANHEDKVMQPHEQAVTTQLSADIVARVVQAYYFDGMVDYQHVLAVHADVARRRKRHWVEPHFEKGGLMDIDQEELMILAPPLFSPKDIPEKLVLRPSINLSSRLKQEFVVREKWEMEIGQSFALDFNIEEIPQKINWEDKIPKGSIDWEWQMAISKLFDERPIWIRRSLHDRLLEIGVKASIDQLKRLLFRTAYYFATGPFRGFLIKNGYDPRKDPESRIYQRVDFRIPPPLRNSDDTSTAGRMEHTWKDICAFRVFPRKSFTSLQLFELADDYIQQEIRKPTRQTSCSRSTGWITKSRFHRLKLCVSVRFLSLLSTKEAKDLMKAAAERLEKSKRLHDFQKESGPDEEGSLHVDGDNHDAGAPEINSTGMTHVAMGVDDKDEAEDEEVEDDEDEEEELDEDTLQHGVGGNVNFSLQPGSDLIGGNITKNYLEKLLGKSPFAEGSKDYQINSKAQDDDMSDGEYHIYEQDSDDNAAYFDDDNAI